jgi:hypothetical protein
MCKIRIKCLHKSRNKPRTPSDGVQSSYKQPGGTLIKTGNCFHMESEPKNNWPQTSQLIAADNIKISQAAINKCQLVDRESIRGQQAGEEIESGDGDAQIVTKS